MRFFKQKSKFYGPLKLKIENRLSRKPSYFDKEFIHISKIKIGHSEICVIYHHHLLV